MKKLTLDIRDESRRLFQGEADELVVPMHDGLMGILPDHAPLIGLLKKGSIRLSSGQKEETIAIPGGLLEIMNNKVEILAFSPAEDLN